MSIEFTLRWLSKYYNQVNLIAEYYNKGIISHII